MLEILVTLGVIAAVMTLLLPALNLGKGAEMGRTLREVAGTLRGAFDGAVLSRTPHRVVFDLKKSQYWAEIAVGLPKGMRPGTAPLDAFSNPKNEEDDIKRLAEQIADDLKNNPRKVKDSEDENYPPRSPLRLNTLLLTPPTWQILDDAVLQRRSLPSGMVFAALATDTDGQKVELFKSPEGTMVSIQFYPSGRTQQALIQLGYLSEDGQSIREDGPRFTLSLDPFSGQSQLLEGFQEVDFVRANR